MKDIITENVEIVISADGTKVLVNAPDCVLRVTFVKNIRINDMREKGDGDI